MKRRRRNRPLLVALYLNAGLLACVLVVAMVRGGSPTLLSPAMADPAPIAGGGGVYLMPGQLSQNVWGVYMMDIDQQTLQVYQYTPGDNLLKLKAARSFKYDRKLMNFNTGTPSPDEVKQLVERELEPARGSGSTNSAPGADK